MELLNPIEVRVLGCLIEKELTTPEYYPLSLNALTNACNQKSNRDPILSLQESDIVRALDSLRHLGLAMQAASDGGRVPKYRHNLMQKLYLEPNELAILCELLVRGPQTIGELRTRAERMHPFPSLETVEEALDSMIERQAPLVLKLPRQPGRKESRFCHLLAGIPQSEDAYQEGPPPEAARLHVEETDSRITKLEETVKQLQQDVLALQRELAIFRSQFD